MRHRKVRSKDLRCTRSGVLCGLREFCVDRRDKKKGDDLSTVAL